MSRLVDDEDFAGKTIIIAHTNLSEVMFGFEDGTSLTLSVEQMFPGVHGITTEGVKAPEQH